MHRSVFLKCLENFGFESRVFPDVNFLLVESLENAHAELSSFSELRLFDSQRLLLAQTNPLLFGPDRYFTFDLRLHQREPWPILPNTWFLSLNLVQFFSEIFSRDRLESRIVFFLEVLELNLDPPSTLEIMVLKLGARIRSIG